LACQQLSPPAGYGLLIQPKKLSQLAVAAMALLQTFHSRIEPPLLFVEQTVEQDHRCPLLVGWVLGTSPQDLAGGPLLLAAAPLRGGVKIQALNQPASIAARRL
jgi:hypothetical protein